MHDSGGREYASSALQRCAEDQHDWDTHDHGTYKVRQCKKCKIIQTKSEKGEDAGTWVEAEDIELL